MDASELSACPVKHELRAARTYFIERNIDEWEQMEMGIYLKCEDKNARRRGNIKQTKLVGIHLQFMSYLYSMSHSCLVASYLQANQEALLEHQF